MTAPAPSGADIRVAKQGGQLRIETPGRITAGFLMAPAFSILGLVTAIIIYMLNPPHFIPALPLFFGATAIIVGAGLSFSWRPKPETMLFDREAIRVLDAKGNATSRRMSLAELGGFVLRYPKLPHRKVPWGEDLYVRTALFATTEVIPDGFAVWHERDVQGALESITVTREELSTETLEMPLAIDVHWDDLKWLGKMLGEHLLSLRGGRPEEDQ